MFRKQREREVRIGEQEGRTTNVDVHIKRSENVTRLKASCFLSMQIIHTMKILFELLFAHENFPHKYANITLRKSGHFIIQIEQIFQSFRTAIKRKNQQ